MALTDQNLWMFIGALGIWFIEASYVPQILRLWRRKEASDISLFFPGLNLTGRLLAFAYAFHIAEAVLAVGFLVGISLRTTLLLQVLYYRVGKEPEPEAIVTLAVSEA